MNWVSVSTTSGRIEAFLIKGFLESNGIKAKIAPTRLQPHFTSGRFNVSIDNLLWDIFVSGRNVQNAKRLLKARQPIRKPDNTAVRTLALVIVTLLTVMLITSLYNFFA